MLSEIAWSSRPAYLITDGRSPQPQTVLRLLDKVPCRIGAVQLREQSRSDEELRRIIECLARPLADSGVALLVNGRIELAEEFSLGVHLQRGTQRIVEARRKSIPLIGYSAHSVDEARGALDVGASFVTLSPLFSPRSKPDYRGSVLGIETLRSACLAGVCNGPILALGGIDCSNAADVRAAGAAGFSCISAVFSAVNPVQALDELVRCWDGR